MKVTFATLSDKLAKDILRERPEMPARAAAIAAHDLARGILRLLTQTHEEIQSDWSWVSIDSRWIGEVVRNAGKN